MPARSTTASCSVRSCSAASTRASSTAARRSARTTARASSAVRVAGTTPRAIASSSVVTSRLAASSPARATRTRGATSVPSVGSGPSGSSTAPVRAFTQTTLPWLSATASPINSTTPGSSGTTPAPRTSVPSASDQSARAVWAAAAGPSAPPRRSRNASPSSGTTYAEVLGTPRSTSPSLWAASEGSVTSVAPSGSAVTNARGPVPPPFTLRAAKTKRWPRSTCQPAAVPSCSAPALTPTPAARTGHRWPSARRGCLAARPCPCRARRCGLRRAPSRGDGRRSHRCSPDV